MTAYNDAVNNDACPFCKSEYECNKQANLYFRGLYCSKCNFEIEYSGSKIQAARSTLKNTSFTYNQNPFPHHSEFNIFIIYLFKQNKLALFDRYDALIFSAFINPDINLIKSIALKFNKLSNIV